MEFQSAELDLHVRFMGKQIFIRVRQIALFTRVVQGWNIYVQAKDIRPCKERIPILNIVSQTC